MPALHHYQETNPRLGTPSGLCRERSLRAYDGVVNVVGEPKSRDFRLSQALARPVVKKGVFRRSRKWMIRLGGKFKFGVVSRVYLRAKDHCGTRFCSGGTHEKNETSGGYNIPCRCFPGECSNAF